MKKIILPLLITVLVVGTFLPVVFADVPLTTRYDNTGHYGMVAAGVGLDGTSSGSISISIPGTVEAAYLYWAGNGLQGSGDDTITFDGTQITADITLEEGWGVFYHYSFAYIKDVKTLVSASDNSYTISDVDIMINYGAGLVVIYEDPSLPINRVILMDGADGFWFNWDPDLGPNSEVACFQFDADTCVRNADMFLFSGGTEHDDRPNDVWTLTGSGAPITDIIGYAGAQASGETYPLYAIDGASWDTYSDNIEVSASDQWLCVQIESIESWEDSQATDYAGRGTSGLFIAAGLVLPICEEEEDYEGLTPGFWKNHANCWYEYDDGDSFASVFGVSVTINAQGKRLGNDDPTLMEALNAKGGVNVAKGEYGALVRHAVAALLNADHPEINYPMSEADIIEAVADAINGLRDATELKDMLETFNNAGGGIDAHCNPI